MSTIFLHFLWEFVGYVTFVWNDIFPCVPEKHQKKIWNKEIYFFNFLKQFSEQKYLHAEMFRQ